ncbi:MAG: tRNA pseudouridine(55) synthase TruB [Clostridia bacterium]|nr:tRNA pseudouridine(55) synthase TruB [Clostridia bacterium]
MKIQGVVNLLKPPGMTSHDAVILLRKIFKQKRVGHTGTLDPAASGVLPVCVGKATRLAEYALQYDKSYRAEMILGVETSTQDMEGEILGVTDASSVSKEQICEIIKNFKGVIKQIPPAFSAVKHEGKKSYELARKGLEVPLKKREVNIKKIDIVRFYPERPHPRAVLDIHCSKGTYIRTLCSDIGEQLGKCAALNFLIRTASGPFDLESTVTIEELSHRGSKYLLPASYLVMDLPLLLLDRFDVKSISNGRQIIVRDINLCKDIPSNTQMRLMYNNKLVAIGLLVRNEKNEAIVKPKKVLV